LHASEVRRRCPNTSLRVRRDLDPATFELASRPRDHNEAMGIASPNASTRNRPLAKGTIAMTDQFPPPGWLPRPETWPYWLPTTQLGPFTPPPPNDPWKQVSAQWWQQPAGARAAAEPSQPHDAWDRTPPAWLRSEVPPLSSAGILGSFPYPNDSTTRPSQGTGILGSLGQPWHQSAPGGILAPLERLNPERPQAIPAWLQSAMPFAANAGSAAPWSPWPYLYPLLSQPQTHYTAAPQPNNNDAIAAPLEHLESAQYWGAGSTPQGASGERPASGFYLSPVPPAPDWDSMSTDPADGAAQMFAAPPSPTSWGAYTPASAAEQSSTDEAAKAQEARDAAAMRVSRRERPAAVARFASPAPDIELDIGEPSFRERARLNLLDSYSRGTLFGAGHLASLAHRAVTPDEPDITPDTKRVHDSLREDYRQIGADLARYDQMRPFGNSGEFAAAALGQLGGGMLSPESWLGLGAKGATWLWRALKAGLQQGTINAATDPVIQGLNIGAGVQDQYDPLRTAIAGGTGFLTGATAKSLAEGLSRLGVRLHSAGAGEANPSAIFARQELAPVATELGKITERNAQVQAALEAIKEYRFEKLPRDLFEHHQGFERREGTVAVRMGKGPRESNVFGTNSTLSTYTPEDRIEANWLRGDLVRKNRELPRGNLIGRGPNDAVYHAETTLLLRLARQDGGSLAGQTLKVYVDREMCPSCRKLLPRIGLELGNPTVTFIDHGGNQLTMQDGNWLR
jgi:hypothetical protein